MSSLENGIPERTVGETRQNLLEKFPQRISVENSCGIPYTKTAGGIPQDTPEGIPI